MPATLKLNIAALVLSVATALPAAAVTLPASISPYGGLVVDATGLNGQRLISQTAAADLNKGVSRGDPEVNDFLIGQQGGFTADLLGQLGGGFSSFSIRLTMFDGDTDPDNFDTDDNFLRVNDVIFGNFSDVVTTTTDAQGNAINGLNDGLGFAGDETDTGTFTLEDSAVLADLFASLQLTNALTFEIDKRDASGNFVDFTSGTRIPHASTGFAPSILPPASVAAVPLPASGLLFLGGLAGLGALRRRAKA